MSLQREPVVWAAGVTRMIEAVIPVLLIFGVINWSDEQLGAVLLAIGVVVSTVASWFTRNAVYSPSTVDAMMNSVGEPDIPPSE